MFNCTLCLNPLRGNRPGISCDGCKKEYHAFCITKTANIINLHNTIPGLSRKCSDCIKNCVLLDPTGVQKIVETKLDDALKSLKNQIMSIKLKVDKIAESEPPAVQPKYSDVQKDKSQPGILIRPNNSEQEHNQTKADILNSTDPRQENLQ
ncbi:unnamed protein product, partial [Psylliodes chrysocephalus]